MKPKHLILVIVVLLVAGGVWLARSGWRTSASETSTLRVGSKRADTPPTPGQLLNRPGRLAPPIPNRRFSDFTPEQRVQFARQGHGPGG